MRFSTLALYLVSAALAVFIALTFSQASLYQGEYHPVGNDSFYHARRIIDTAGETGFYQFDEQIHVPEGSRIVWPWAYDYLLGQALAIWQALNPDAAPMGFLALLPPFVLLINVGLFVALTGAVGLSTPLRAVACLGYALFPFTQLLHGVGIIDHHMIEHLFVLASVLLTLAWSRQPASKPRAVGLALLLGIAPAFHTGLFILQLPLLIGVALLWLRAERFDRASTIRFSLVLPIATLLVSLPSGALREGLFDFSLLSWFHVYVSLCTAIAMSFMSARTFDRRALLQGVALALVLAIPILWAAGTGVAFLRGDILLLDRIEEMRSPVAQLLDGQWRSMIGLYSGLLLALPLFVGFYLWRLGPKQPAPAVMFSSAALMGLALLTLQIRLEYFGSFALLLGAPLLLQTLTPVRLRQPLLMTFAGVIILAVAYRPPLSDQLFSRQSLSIDVDYEIAVDAFPALRAACRDQPGIVLASNNFGHPVRYHSDCSVIANNFLLTPLHEAKVRELEALWQMTPHELRDARPPIRYVLVVLRQLYLPDEGGVRPASAAELAAANPPLALKLTHMPSLPDGYTVLYERRLKEDDRDLPIVRLLRID